MTATMTPAKVEQYREFRRRGAATLTARHNARAGALFEDLEFMLEHGETVERALTRLGSNLSAMRGLAKRHRRDDITALLRGEVPA